MAFLVAEPIALTPTTTAAANYPITISSLGLTLVNDDWLILSVACAATSGTLSTASSGWTEIAELGVTSGNRMARYKAKVASGTVGDVQIDLSAGTGQWSGSIEQWRDADATDCIDSSAGSAGSSGGAVISEVSGELNSGGINKPNTDNCAISYFSSSRLSGVGTALRFKPDEVVGRLIQSADDGTVYRSIAIGTAQQTTAAATAKTVYVEKSSRIGSITVAIKNKTNGGTERDCRAGVEKMAWMGTFGTTHESLGTTWGAPSTFVAWTGGTIGGITADTNAPTISNDQVVGGLAWGAWTSVSSNVSTAGAIVGGWIALPSTIDLTGKFISLEWFQSLLGALFGAEGVFLALGDNASASTGNAVVYRLAPKLAIIQNKVNTSIIDPATATTFDAEGSINLATINKVGFFYHRVGSLTSARVILVRNLLAIANSILTGGSSGKPLDIRFLDAALNGWGYTGICEKQGDAVLVKTDVQFGNGTIPTYVDTTATLLNTPAAYSTGTQPFWNAGANSITVGMKAASGDTMNFIASAMAAGAGAEQNFTIDAASSASAIYSSQGASIIGMAVTLQAVVDPIGPTYSGCGPINTKGADLTNFSVTDTTATASEAAVVVDVSGSTLSSGTIDVTGTAAGYHLELGTAVTAITLANVTFTGTPATDKVHVLKTLTTVTAGSFVVGVHYRINTVGTTDFTLIGASANTIGVNFTATGVGSGTGTADQAVKITISGTTSLAEADCTTAGAPVWVAAPALNQVVIVSGFTAGSRIQIYDTTSSTELFNGTATAGDTVVSGTTATWTDPLAASANRAIRVRVSYVSGVTAKNFIETSGLTCGQTSGTAEITYPVSPTDDTVYNANAINGSTVTGVTFTDAATDVVNINVVANSISWKTIYAAWVYYVFGATGIASDIDYIDAVDEANYILSNMIIKNTSSPTAPLEVTGGYGRDFTTGATIDLADTTGGTLIFAPDHVVSYAVGSGVTAQDITDIAAASGTAAATATLAAAQTTPIHSDVRKVVGITVDGTGTEGDPWGPA